MAQNTPTPLLWVGASKDDLRRFPGAVRDRMGFALYLAQIGQRSRDAKPLKGLGSGVTEVVSNFDTNTYRAVYTASFRDFVYSSARIPEEIEARNCDTQGGDRPGKAASAIGRTAL